MTKVKICGITNLEDAQGALEAGADVLGFNFYKKSARYIVPNVAKEIIQKLPGDVTKVGIFVNSTVGEIEAALAEACVEFAQLHGDENPEFVRQLVASTGAKVIKAFRVTSEFQPNVAADYEAADFLLDTDCREFGGSGRTFDWAAALKFKDFVPRFYLAGGLTPDNVSEAIRRVRPFAVDVCSGVELEKGKKDLFKVNAFVRNAKNAL